MGVEEENAMVAEALALVDKAIALVDRAMAFAAQRHDNESVSALGTIREDFLRRSRSYLHKDAHEHPDS